MAKYNINDKLGEGQHLFVQRIDGRKGKFICGYCGKEFEANISNIARNVKKSCGCLKDLTGKRFGKLVVLKYTGKNNNQRAKLWECLCDCGNITEVSTGNLQSGHTTSCGCAQKIAQLNNAHKKMIGKRFGKLTVLEDTQKRNYNQTIIWKCQCDCGGIIEVPTNHLNSGHTQSCGCIQSINEEKIGNILQDMDINYIKQYWFNDCRNPKTNNVLRFDFYLPDYNCCIEYDGEQHFKVLGGWSTKEHLKETQYRDSIKNKYCYENNIKLIRISYLDKNNIENILKEELNV